MERHIAAKAQKNATRVNDAQTNSARSYSSAAHPLLELQQSIGNRAVGRLINSPYIQAKLQVSVPSDPSEREADRVADTIMRMPEPESAEEGSQRIQTEPLSAQLSPAAGMSLATGRSAGVVIQRLCTECEDKKEREGRPVEMVHRNAAPERLLEDDEEEELVQPKEAQTSAAHVAAPAADNIHALGGGGGSPLPEAARAFFEPKFGADFSRVRIHTDSRAAETAASINARAFTVGRNVAFGQGQYAPHSHEGRQLLAHELTHVVQQTGSQLRRTQLNFPPTHAGDMHAIGESRIVQRQADAAPQESDKDRHKAALESIQGHAMFTLLTLLQAQPSDVLSDEATGQEVGGPRLVTAMHVVTAKEKSWAKFVASHNGELAALPVDQIGDIISFLGGPKDARYYKADQFEGKFDGSVDPAGLITLYFRVRFDMDGVRFGRALPGTPEWEKETDEGRRIFEAEFKSVVEATWKGTIKPACRIGSVNEFQTSVVVTVVKSGEHTLFKVVNEGAEGSSNAEPGEGTLKVGDTKERPRTQQVVDPTGKRPEQLTTTQAPAAHEFGHAIGLHHPRCRGRDDTCYGVTAEERRDIMGAGNMLQVIKRGGKVVHDDFVPFVQIARRWGQDVFPGLDACNVWSAK